MILRTRITVSPLSLTVVSVSSSRTTAFTSAACFLEGCCAAARNQSGVPATACMAGNNTRTIVAIPKLIRLVCTDTSSRKYYLLIIARLDLAKKITNIGILVRTEKDPIHAEYTTGLNFLTIHF